MPPQLQNGLNFSAKVIQGTLDSLPQAVRAFVESSVRLCEPDRVHICDGSEGENQQLLDQMEAEGMIKRLRKLDNWSAPSPTPAHTLPSPASGLLARGGGGGG